MVKLHKLAFVDASRKGEVEWASLFKRNEGQHTYAHSTRTVFSIQRCLRSHVSPNCHGHEVVIKEPYPPFSLFSPFLHPPIVCNCCCVTALILCSVCMYAHQCQTPAIVPNLSSSMFVLRPPSISLSTFPAVPSIPAAALCKPTDKQVHLGA